MREHALHRREDLLAPHRFRQVPGEAELAQFLPARAVVDRAVENEPQVRNRGYFPDPARKLDSVHAGHAVIGQHGLKGLAAIHRAPQHAQRVHGRGYRLHFVLGRLEQFADHAAVRVVVVDDEHATAFGRRGRRCVLHDFARARREPGREPENGSCARAALHADFAAHQFREPLDDREPEAGAAVLPRRRGVRLREGTKELRLLHGREADAGVAHGEPDQVIHRPALARDVNRNLARAR